MDGGCAVKIALLQEDCGEDVSPAQDIVISEAFWASVALGVYHVRYPKRDLTLSPARPGSNPLDWQIAGQTNAG